MSENMDLSPSSPGMKTKLSGIGRQAQIHRPYQ